VGEDGRAWRDQGSCGVLTAAISAPGHRAGFHSYDLLGTIDPSSYTEFFRHFMILIAQTSKFRLSDSECVRYIIRPLYR